MIADRNIAEMLKSDQWENPNVRCRLAGKMNKKYGKSSHVDFYEGQRWYNIFNK